MPDKEKEVETILDANESIVDVIGETLEVSEDGKKLIKKKIKTGTCRIFVEMVNEEIPGGIRITNRE